MGRNGALVRILVGEVCGGGARGVMRLHTYGRKLGDTAAPASHATLHGTWDKAGYPKHIPAKLFKTAVLFFC